MAGFHVGRRRMEPIDILRVCYPARKQIIPCLLGEPGIGKTQCVYQLGEELGVKVHMMNMNGKTPNEVVGMAMPNNETGTMEMFDYGILCEARDGEIVIIDEMLTSAPSCLNAILTLAESRILPSGKKIADVMIVAAANPLPSPDRVSLAVRDRFQFIEVRFSKNSWREYIRREYGIIPSNNLIHRIQVQGKEYNVPTPRTITKYIWWLSKVCTTKQQRLEVYDVIEAVFDKGMAKDFREMFETKPKNEQIMDALYDCGVRFASVSGSTTAWTTEDDNVRIQVNKPIEEMDAMELLEFLTKLNNWADIEKQLNTIEMD